MATEQLPGIEFSRCIDKIYVRSLSYFDKCNQSAEQIDCLLARHSRSEFSCGRYPTGNKPSEEIEPERFYHGFVLGLLVELKDRYHVISNRESGFGRYDVMLEPIASVDNSSKAHNGYAPAYVLEFKVYDGGEEENLQDTVKAALRQITEKQYDAELMAKGIPSENIRHYGFAFRGKEVLIGTDEG